MKREKENSLIRNKRNYAVFIRRRNFAEMAHKYLVIISLTQNRGFERVAQIISLFSALSTVESAYYFLCRTSSFVFLLKKRFLS